ncbi:ABC transporter substrate-binding protein [Cognatiyoonia sp. IB215446]|uniref:ABC transporter substrate-binding protein n=1 Tax=Cognatiyoonia sp. IB215446 TaxID=3097355 RepID=UPI002A17591E|nr:ABC transporter substrate-binding protein [Cognatiyoonia sp. IB215446]MDX8350422.1 ABC transporter substrate-binding protein [Cognatiyoonia sp. IB215446]
MRMLLMAFVGLALSATLGMAQDTRTVTDDLGRIVEIPAEPQRIVSLDDNSITLPLIDLGIDLYGSAGRITEAGTPFVRGLLDTYGMSVAAGDLVFLGSQWEIDIETVAAAEPDFILAGAYQADLLEKLEALAPVYVVEEKSEPWFVQNSIARAMGMEETLAARKAAYEQRITETIETLNITPGSTFSVLQPDADGVWTYHGLYAVTTVLLDLGMVPNAITQELEETGPDFGDKVSYERFLDLDADYVFVTYFTGSDWGELDWQIGHLNNFSQNWCDLLPACADGRLIFMPYEPAGAPTFAALNASLDIISSQIATRAATR